MSEPNKQDKTQTSRTGSWMAIGIALGVAFGTILDNLAGGVAAGVVIGVGLSAWLEAKRGERTHNREPDERP